MMPVIELSIYERAVLRTLFDARRPVYGPCIESLEDYSRVWLLEEKPVAEAYKSLCEKGLVAAKPFGYYTTLYQLTDRGREVALEVVRDE